MRHGKLSPKGLVRRYLDEKTKAEIHISGVTAEIAICMQHSSEHNYSPLSYLSVWLPDVLRLTMQRQKGVGDVLGQLKGPAGAKLIGNEPITENVRYGGLNPRLVDLAGGGQQGHRDLFIEVMENLTEGLDEIATNIREMINAIDEQKKETE